MRESGIKEMQASLLILGAGPMAARLIEEIEALEPSRYVVLGVVDSQPPDERAPRFIDCCDRRGSNRCCCARARNTTSSS